MGEKKTIKENGYCCTDCGAQFLTERGVHTAMQTECCVCKQSKICLPIRYYNYLQLPNNSLTPKK